MSNEANTPSDGRDAELLALAEFFTPNSPRATLTFADIFMSENTPHFMELIERALRSAILPSPVGNPSREERAQTIFKGMVHPTNDWMLPVFSEDREACFATVDALAQLAPKSVVNPSREEELVASIATSLEGHSFGLRRGEHHKEVAARIIGDVLRRLAELPMTDPLFTAAGDEK